MSTIRTNTITDAAGTGAPDFPNGLTVAGQSPVTTTSVLNATAGASVGAVGTYALLKFATNTAANEGETYAGSILRYASANGTIGGAPSGTWRLMGNTTSGSNAGSTSVFLRIS